MNFEQAIDIAKSGLGFGLNAIIFGLGLIIQCLGFALDLDESGLAGELAWHFVAVLMSLTLCSIFRLCN